MTEPRTALILTGGGAHLKGVAELVEEIFGVSCSIGKPRYFSGISTVHEGPEYAAPLGMIRYAVRSATKHAEEKISLFINLFRGRTDVYPLRWESLKGISGYSPACGNEWRQGISNIPIT